MCDCMEVGMLIAIEYKLGQFLVELSIFRSQKNIPRGVTTTLYSVIAAYGILAPPPTLLLFS